MRAGSVKFVTFSSFSVWLFSLLEMDIPPIVDMRLLSSGKLNIFIKRGRQYRVVGVNKCWKLSIFNLKAVREKTLGRKQTSTGECIGEIWEKKNQASNGSW